MNDLIRRAVAADAGRIGECVSAAYEHYVARIGRPPGPMLDDYGAVIRDHDVHVVDGDAAIAGVVVLMAGDGRLLLDNIAVHPRAQGSRLGQRLLVFGERRARSRGYAALDLYTHALMTENIAWYERQGYRRTARVTEKGFDRIYMRKVLG